MKKYLSIIATGLLLLGGTVHASVFTPTYLSYGARGVDVQRLQAFLFSQGYFSGPVSGNFYGLTRDALKRFQSQNALPATGYFGPLSRAKAEALLAISVPKEQPKPVTVVPPVVLPPTPAPVVSVLPPVIVIEQPIVPTPAPVSLPPPPTPTPVVITPVATAAPAPDPAPALKIPRCNLYAFPETGSSFHFSAGLEKDAEPGAEINYGVGPITGPITRSIIVTATTTFTLTERISPDMHPDWQPITTCSATVAPF